MKKAVKYKVIIGLLLLVVIIQFIALIISRPKKPIPPPITIKGRIAIVIDDWGYNLNNLDILGQIKAPLTLAVLPNLAYSRKVSLQADSLGFEVILHLPMEPMEKFKLEKDTITTSMDETAIVNILNQDLASVGHAKGVSNHMGSLVTSDSKIMGIIFRQLKKKNLYFLDSFVTPKSICPGLAKQLHLRFAERDIFLDNEEDAVYIKGEINKLKGRAGLYGQAIGIGHDRKVTLEVLKEVVPELKQQGFEFVFVSELVK